MWHAVFLLLNVVDWWCKMVEVNTCASISGFSHHEDPKGPPVSALCVSSPVNDLWSHVLYSSTEGICSFIMINGFFTQSKIWKKRKRFLKKWKKEHDDKSKVLYVYQSHWPVILMCPSSSNKILLQEIYHTVSLTLSHSIQISICNV